jgi:hypothetical protein
MMSNMVDGFVDQGIKLSFRNILQLRGRFVDPFPQATDQFQSLLSGRRFVRPIRHHADVLFSVQWAAKKPSNRLPDVRREIAGLVEHVAGHDSSLAPSF